MKTDLTRFNFYALRWAYDESIMMMNHQEKGQFEDLRVKAWLSQNGCHLPEDPQQLAKMIGCEPGETISSKVLALWPVGEDGRRRNEELSQEWQETTGRVLAAQASGSLGGQAKSESKTAAARLNGAVGGASKSESKAEAARLNGKLGGHPITKAKDTSNPSEGTLETQAKAVSNPSEAQRNVTLHNVTHVHNVNANVRESDAIGEQTQSFSRFDNVIDDDSDNPVTGNGKWIDPLEDIEIFGNPAEDLADLLHETILPEYQEKSTYGWKKFWTDDFDGLLKSYRYPVIEEVINFLPKLREIKYVHTGKYFVEHFPDLLKQVVKIKKGKAGAAGQVN
jgi:hypothetical protein